MRTIVRFDEYEVDLPAGQLYKRGVKIVLREKSFQVLAALLEHPGEVVTREELRQRLWRDEVFVDFDNNLNTAVARLREALCDSAEQPRFIETLPKHGYRFLVSVAEPPSDKEAEPLPCGPEPPARVRIALPERLGNRAAVAAAQQHKAGWRVAMAAALLLAAAGFGFYSLFFSAHRLPFQSIKITKVSGTHNATIGALSPDGNYLAYVIDKEGEGSLWLRHLASESSVQIVPPQPVDYWGLRFSPDGNHIYYSHTSPASGTDSEWYDLYRIPALGGTPQLLIKNVGSISFSPDGQRFVFRRASYPDARNYNLIIADADGKNERSILTVPMRILGAEWSPDGKTVVIVLQDEASNNGRTVFSIDPNTGKQKEVLRPPYTIDAASWLSNRKALAVTFVTTMDFQHQVGLISYPGGEFRRITADTNDYTSPLGYFPVTLSISSDGRTIATIKKETVRDVYLSSGEKADYSDIRQITFGDPTPRISWTRDGKLLAEQGRAIRVISLDGRLLNEIAAEKESGAFQPHGCSDGHVVFSRIFLKSLSSNIWRSEADGTGLVRLTKGENDQRPMCSPDAKSVYYLDLAANAYFRIPIDGGAPERVSKENADLPGFDIARDGKTIVLGTFDDETQKPNITLVSLESGRALRTFAYDVRHEGRLAFSPDGKGVVYPIRENDVDNLWLQPLDGSAGRKLTNFSSLKIYSYQWSPDGKSMALVRGDSPSDVVLIQDAGKR